ncbi:MAG: glycosyltransferase family 2 protein [Candidatus Omnitrophica bacterium]|nr:glycosyltransferase family 2 protein [Candidatus Omnitrophota bacterium]
MSDVSVVMAVHNGERYVGESLASLLCQSWAGFEAIVVDDGSTDGTAEILDRLSQSDRRIRVVRQDHRGLTPSLNRAVSLARGEYVARQDADDHSEPERLAQQLRFLDAHPAVAAVGTAGWVMDEEGDPVAPLMAPTGSRRVAALLRQARATPIHGSMMIRRSAVEAVGGYRDAFRASQDLDLWLRLSERFPIDNLPEGLYAWRLNSEGVYATRREEQLKYCGIALAFARERQRFGDDSCALLQECAGDLDAFAKRFRMRGLLHALWGELLFRGLGDPGVARRELGAALRSGACHPKTIGFFVWSALGLSWPGRAPLTVQSHG